MSISASIGFKASLLVLTVAGASTGAFAMQADPSIPVAATCPACADQASPAALQPLPYQTRAKGVHGDRFLIGMGDGHAAYPLMVDPPLWLEQEVTASDGPTGGGLGFSVAVSGTTAFIGTPTAGANGYSNGAVYVFDESGGTRSQAQKLVADDDIVNEAFGWSMAIEGTTAFVGAPFANNNGSGGAVYVFSESNGIWTQTQKLTASDGGPSDQFGFSVALDGTTALVGANAAIVNDDYYQGAVYVFKNTNGTWTQTQKLTASDGAQYDVFGVSVALDGATAMIGASGNNNGTGAAYVFSKSDGTWSQAQKLIASDGAPSDGFGYSVALDGAIALVGAPDATINGHPSQGAAYVFNQSNGSWTQAQKLTASYGTEFSFFGASLALTDTTALVGAPACQLGICAFTWGNAYMFDESNGAWSLSQRLTASNAEAFDSFGAAIAVSGTTVLVGAPGAGGLGAAYFEAESNLNLSVSAPQSVNPGQQYISQTIATNNCSAASPAVTATVTVPAAASFVSATASQGSCSEATGAVACDFGQIPGNAGTATANVTLKATGNVGDTINNTASIAHATPQLGASAPTTITAGGSCPDGYTEYDGSLNVGERAHSPIYRAPAGEENAILIGPSGFQLYAAFQNARFGRKIFRIPGNEVHRQAPAGYFTWAVKAGDTGGVYTLCVLHP